MDTFRNIVPNIKPQPKQKQTFIPVDVLDKTLKGYEENIFVQNLLTRVPYPFETKQIEDVIAAYYLGTVSGGYMAGAVTFPFIDYKGNIRAIQCKLFDGDNHTTTTGFVHSLLYDHYIKNSKPVPEWLAEYRRNELKVSCLFGEHLLSRYPKNPVALVEAPKTVVYGSLYFGLPKDHNGFIWLAVYNKSSFSFDKLKVLAGRRVYVFPDLSKDGSTFQEWQEKGKAYEAKIPGVKFVFDEFIEKSADIVDRINGADLADYLIQFDWRQFRKDHINRDAVEHYASYRVPYNVNDTEDLKSLISGYSFETGKDITPDEYRRSVLAYLNGNTLNIDQKKCRKRFLLN
ncbi:MAG: DUF6371 domain-containing protein [Mangrovibacterium sp.]|nr:DUF6371 domain-containing protein [Mangrovibacterium sp.]